MAELMFKPADELAGLVRSGELTSRELVEAGLERARRRSPTSTLSSTSTTTPRSPPLTRSARRSAPLRRGADRDQGELTPSPASASLWVPTCSATSSRIMTLRGAAASATPASSRWPHRRAGVRHRPGHRNAPLRPDAQPLGHASARPAARRAGRPRRRRRHGAARPRHRRRWIDPHPGRLLRARRAEAARGRISPARRTATTSSTRTASSAARSPTPPPCSTCSRVTRLATPPGRRRRPSRSPLPSARRDVCASAFDHVADLHRPRSVASRPSTTPRSCSPRSATTSRSSRRPGRETTCSAPSSRSSARRSPRSPSSEASSRAASRARSCGAALVDLLGGDPRAHAVDYYLARTPAWRGLAPDHRRVGRLRRGPAAVARGAARRIGEIDACSDTPWDHFRRSGEFTPYTALFNITGQPAISLPLYQGEDGLPVGVQLAGRPADEATLLSLSAQLETALADLGQSGARRWPRPERCSAADAVDRGGTFGRSKLRESRKVPGGSNAGRSQSGTAPSKHVLTAVVVDEPR